MARFCGRAFLLGLESLDSDRQAMFTRHGKNKDGRWSLVETIVDDAMLRLLGEDISLDGNSNPRAR